MIPNDPVMLLSYVNTQLRDHYRSLDELCKTLQINQNELVEKLQNLDYEYNAVQNAFI